MVDDSKWIKALYSKMYRPLSQHLAGLLRTRYYGATLDLEDCIQDTFVALWEARTVLRTHPNIEAWIYVTADNKLRDKARAFWTKNKHHAFSIDEDDGDRPLLDRVTPPAQSSTTAEHQIAGIIDLIGEDSYALLIAYYDNNIDKKALARKHNLTLGALKMRVLRLLQKIRIKNLALFFLLIPLLLGLLAQ